MKSKIKNISIRQKSATEVNNIYSVSFEQGGKFMTKEATKTLDVVKILIYHESKKAFVLVKQFRPLVYVNHPDLAIRYELCGGRVDKPLSYVDIAREEVLEECGFDVRCEDIQRVTQVVTGGTMTLYFVKVDDTMRVSDGGGIDNEMIEVVYLPLDEVRAFMFDENMPKRPALMFMLSWYLNGGFEI
jgi:UDP-sugar diphosphatase